MLFCDSQIKSSILPKAKRGLFKAINSKKVFHIYLHPHDLLRYSSLKNDLDRFLSLIRKMSKEGKIKVMTMGDFWKMLDKKR